MCNRSEDITELAKALVAFSAEVKSISHDATNPHFKSQYTSLDHMIDETKPILTKNGLTVMQFPGGDGQKITVRTMILHTSGQWIESEPLTLNAVKNDPQGAGSAITYARRYSYAAALSLSLGDDDDGNASSYSPHEARTATQSQRQTNTSSQTHNGSQRQNGGENVHTISSKVFKLREEKGLTWQQLNDFASNLLNREIKFLKKDITDINEWRLLEDALADMDEPVPVGNNDFPF